MRWLRKLLPGSGKVQKSARPSGFRPQVESLDDRIVPTVSTAVTAGGSLTIAVSTDDVLVGIDPATGAISQTAITNVRTAQIFRDANGAFGADIVFLDGSWQHIDSSPLLGSFTLSAAEVQARFGGPLLDVGTAYDTAGNVRVELLVSNDTNTDQSALGHIMQFDQAAGGGLVDLAPILGNSVRWVSAYESIDGGTGIALSQLTAGGDTPTDLTDDQLLARKFDFTSGSLALLYQGDGLNPAAVAEYSQSVLFTNPAGFPGIPSTTLVGPNTNRTVVIDVTFDGLDTLAAVTTQDIQEKGYALQFTTTTGTPSVFAPAVPTTTVVDVVPTPGTIKTGVLQIET